LSSNRYREGYNFKVPFVEVPIIYNVQTREDEIRAETANRDMQLVKLSVKVLFHPEVDRLDTIYTRLGKNYDQKVLPAICNEILRTVVAQFSAAQLLSQRDQVSERIRNLLSERAAQFNIIIDNIAITELTFGKEYLEAIESKQVAQQEAERAKYEVEQAKEAKKSTIIKAEASAKSIELVGKASINNPCNFMI
jgi:prohibitin 2